MKIYLFNPENGVYLGEDFADHSPMRRDEYILPPDATTITPPEAGHGQVLVFNALEQRWDVRPPGSSKLIKMGQMPAHGEWGVD